MWTPSSLTGHATRSFGAYAAATVLGSIPLLLLVLICQRQIVSGLTNGAIKG